MLIAALAGRRRELALLRLAGATRDQVTRMLQAEALIVAATGAVIGTALAIAGLIPLAIATAGSPLPSGPVTVFVGTLAIAIALVLTPTLAGARIILRDPPRPRSNGSEARCVSGVRDREALDLVVKGQESLTGQVEAVVGLQLAVDDVEKIAPGNRAA